MQSQHIESGRLINTRLNIVHKGNDSVPHEFGIKDMSIYTFILYQLGIINHQESAMDDAYKEIYDVT